MIRYIKAAICPDKMMNIVKVTTLSESKDKVLFKNKLGDEMTFIHDGHWWSWHPTGHRVTEAEQKKLNKAWKRYQKRKACNKLK